MQIARRRNRCVFALHTFALYLDLVVNEFLLYTLLSARNSYAGFSRLNLLQDFINK